MNIKLLTEYHLEFLILKWAAEACQSIRLSKCHIDGNHMSRLYCQAHVGPGNIGVSFNPF